MVARFVPTDERRPRRGFVLSSQGFHPSLGSIVLGFRRRRLCTRVSARVKPGALQFICNTTQETSDATTNTTLQDKASTVSSTTFNDVHRTRPRLVQFQHFELHTQTRWFWGHLQTLPYVDLCIIPHTATYRRYKIKLIPGDTLRLHCVYDPECPSDNGDRCDTPRTKNTSGPGHATVTAGFRLRSNPSTE